MTEATPRVSPLEVAVEALAKIVKGCRPTGRWIISGSSGEAVDDPNPSADVVPDGFYDRDAMVVGDLEPTEDKTAFTGWDEDAYEDGRLVFLGGQWRAAAYWEPYTKEDQDNWLESCAEIAETALREMNTVRCATCGRALNQPGDRTTLDCGGDCLRCMAAMGDPACVASMKAIADLDLIRKHAAQGMAQPEFAKDHCYLIAQILDGAPKD